MRARGGRKSAGKTWISSWQVQRSRTRGQKTWAFRVDAEPWTGAPAQKGVFLFPCQACVGLSQLQEKRSQPRVRNKRKRIRATCSYRRRKEGLSASAGVCQKFVFCFEFKNALSAQVTGGVECQKKLERKSGRTVRQQRKRTSLQLLCLCPFFSASAPSKFEFPIFIV